MHDWDYRWKSKTEEHEGSQAGKMILIKIRNHHQNEGNGAKSVAHAQIEESPLFELFTGKWVINWWCRTPSYHETDPCIIKSNPKCHHLFGMTIK